MLLRLFRITDRLGRLVIKCFDWAGGRLLIGTSTSAGWVSRRFSKSTLSTDSTRFEGQVRSLSGLIVVLLVSVGTLTLWATSPQAQNNPVIRFLALGSTPIPGANAADAPPDTGTKLFRGGAGTVVFSMPAGAYDNLFALATGQSTPTRLTSGAADDRDPAWSPDGQKLAFASHRDGNWDLYILNIPTGEVKRLTTDLVYEAKPSWSPDGQWLAYEGYSAGNLDIFISKADGAEGPYPVTRGPAADFDPAWSTDPSGRRIAYVSNRNGNQDIYILSLDEPNEDKALNFTQTPDINESHPTWSPDGSTLAYEGIVNGIPLIYVKSTTDPNAKPLVVSQGTSPAWSPDGGALAFVAAQSQGSLILTGQYGAWDNSVQAFALPSLARSLTWSATSMPNPPQGSLAFAASAPIPAAYTENLSAAAGQANAPYRLINLPGVIAGSQPYLSDQVDGSFVALRDAVNREVGWDFLGRLDQVWWPLDHLAVPGQPFENWHKAGRAFDIIQTYNQGNPAQVELVPEEIGPDTTWRLYVRTATQDGSLGEPLHQLPWDFTARTSGDPAAYEAGGRLKSSIPSGYYVDFTYIAELFGWTRTPTDPTWRQNWPGVLYWQYEKRETLDWWSAMLQLYPDSTLRQAFSTPTPGQPEPTFVTIVPTTQPNASSTPGKSGAPRSSPTPLAPRRTEPPGSNFEP
jgi:TolB protein